jgi:2-polyprenyl-3-methyl-5-hydroxy-6-metoxy-1,4-benzoquinol methylase
MNEHLEAARNFWSKTYWANPPDNHTDILLPLNWSQEKLHGDCEIVLADRRRISRELFPSAEYYTEVDEFDWNGKTVLEFGCGMGADAFLLAKRGAIVTATDIVPSNVEMTDRVLQGFPHVSMIVRDYEDLLSLGQFDVVYCHGVFHHIRPPLDAQAMRALKECTKPDGLMFFMLYTQFYFPQEKLDFEGPYTRGFSFVDTVEIFEPDFGLRSFRHVLAMTCAWVVAGRMEQTWSLA